MFNQGVDEWLKICQLFEVLAHKYCPGVPPLQHRAKASKASKAGQQQTPKAGGKAKPAAEGIEKLRLGDDANRGKSG